MKEDKFDKPSWGDKVILSILKARKKKNKPVKTMRTKAIEDSAKQNYGTDLASELAKLRKKGQGK